MRLKYLAIWKDYKLSVYGNVIIIEKIITIILIWIMFINDHIHNVIGFSNNP